MPHRDDDWTTCVEPLNTLAGLTLVVIAICQDCGTHYPASPRQRVRRCPTCWRQARRR